MSSLKLLARKSSGCSAHLPLLGAFSAGALVTGLASVLLSLCSANPEKVDFEFSMRGIVTPRQENKTLDIFVRWRYFPRDDQCPFSPTDNNCIQYQLWTRSLILNLTLHPSAALPINAEWERVNLALCRAIWAQYSYGIQALSTSLHVNGDGRSAAERKGGLMPYEPGAHGSTCTLGPDTFPPIAFVNELPNLGPY